MKKIISAFLAVAVFAILALTPPLQASWYNTNTYQSETGLALHSNLGWQSFGLVDFDTKLEGFYRLASVASSIPFSYDELFTTTYAGLVKLTGTCSQSKPSNIALRLWQDGQPRPLIIAETDAARFTFTQVFMGGNVLLQGLNLDQGRYTVLKCSLLFEKVQ